MYYGEIKEFDIANGPGVRVSLFVSGCNHHCKGCFQPETWNFWYGQEFTFETLRQIDELLYSPHREGLTILGGEPLDPENIGVVSRITRLRLRHPDKTIWIYTGYKYEELLQRDDTADILRYTDVIVDGEFIEEQKNLTLEYRGSENQRIIDVQKSGKTIALWENQYERMKI